MVTDKLSNLGVFSSEGKTYLTFKNGNSLSILEYDFENKQLNQIDGVALPEMSYHHISTK